MFDDLIDFPEDKEQINNEDVAIVGISACFSDIDKLDDFWKTMLEQKESIRLFPKIRDKDVVLIREEEQEICRAGYMDRIDMFDPEFFNISVSEAKYMDPNQRIFIETVYHAVEDAGITKERLQGSRTGVFVAQSSDLNEQYYEVIRDYYREQYQDISVAGNLKSVMAGRISYYFDLHGPAMVFDTACSSALVAVHQACELLKNNSISQAIVGGVKINILPIRRGLDDDIGIRSKHDKLCAFDNDADGIASGEGAAAIVLKKLSEAEKSHDHIYAVIKGGAINNDGKSAGMTAPNPIAQQEVLCDAWDNAHINPEKLLYIETHGTGTKLGDPIEAEALKCAFAQYTNRKGFCGIGSVKSQYGHLDNIAGLISLIKVALIAERRIIPPTMNFIRPNSQIDFLKSALYVNDVARSITCEDFYCGVSSFGLSGTNCHIVVGTYSHLFVQKQKRDVLVVISAQDLSSYKMLIKSYQEFVKSNSDMNLECFSYSTLSGRSGLNIRAAMVVDSIEQLIDSLNNLSKETNIYDDEKHIYTSLSEKKKDLGDYKDRNEMECANELGVLKRLAKVFVSGGHIMYEKLFGINNVTKMPLPLYPFKKKRCWVEQKKGNRLIDECVVKTDNQMIYKTFFSNQTHWLLDEHKVNNRFVLPGTTYIEMLLQILNEQNVQQEKIFIFEDIFFPHSLNMEKGQKRETYTILNHIKDGYNITIGSWERSSWKKHVIGRVSIQNQGKVINKNIVFPGHDKQFIKDRNIDVEIGEHWTQIERKTYQISEDEYFSKFDIPIKYKMELAASYIWPPALDRAINVVNTIIGNGTYLPFNIGKFEIYDRMPMSFYVTTEVTYKNDEVIKINCDLFDEHGNIFAILIDYVIKRMDSEVKSIPNDAMFHKIIWKETDTVLQKRDVAFKFIFLGNKQNKEICNQLKEKNIDSIFVSYSSEYRNVDEYNYNLSGSVGDFKQLINDVGTDKKLVFVILSLLKLNKDGKLISAEPFDEIDKEFEYFFALAKTLIESKKSSYELIVPTCCAYEINMKERQITPFSRAITAMLQVLMQEKTDLLVRSIDYDEGADISELDSLINSSSNKILYGYRNGKLYLPYWSDVNDTKEIRKYIRAQGVYVIAGNGGLAYEMAKHFVDLGAGKIFLLARHRKQSSALLGFEDKIEELCCDITDEKIVEDTMGYIHRRYSRINGFIHCATRIDNTLLINKNINNALEVIKPKISGTILLSRYLEKDNLDFFVMFSSVSAIVGGVGQIDYVAGNAFLDGYAIYLKKRGINAFSINWAAWNETGLAKRRGIDENENTLFSLSTKTAITLFDTVICTGWNNVIVGKCNEEVWEKINIAIEHKKEVIHNERKKIVADGVANKKEEYKCIETEEEIEEIVKMVWKDVLGISDINVDDTFSKLGGDSILAIRLMNKLKSFFPNVVDITMIYTYPTIKQITECICEKLVITNIDKKGNVGNPVLDDKEQQINDLLNALAQGNIRVEDI